MKRFRKIQLTAVFVLFVMLFSTTAQADIVQLDLLSLGCPTEFNPDSGVWSWQADFDLGVTFTEISHVYIDWSGWITAAIAYYQEGTYYDEYPIDAGIVADLGGNPWPRGASIKGGATIYPLPEPFDSQNEFQKFSSTWSDLLDGTGTISLWYNNHYFGDNGGLVTYGSITLDKAILRVEGTITPEPASILLLAGGLGFIRYKRRISNSVE